MVQGVRKAGKALSTAEKGYKAASGLVNGWTGSNLLPPIPTASLSTQLGGIQGFQLSSSTPGAGQSYEELSFSAQVGITK